MSFDRLRGPFDWSNALFIRLNRNRIVIEPSGNSRIIFLTILINRVKVSTDRKYWFSNFHLENSRSWIFNLWNHIFQTQTSLLQHILVYTYIYNTECLMTHIDLLHFRSVCNSWWSSVFPCRPCVLKIPTYNTLVTDHVYLSKRIIYVIELPGNPAKTAPLEQWFVKAEEDEHGVHHLLHPLTRSYVPLIKATDQNLHPNPYWDRTIKTKMISILNPTNAETA